VKKVSVRPLVPAFLAVMKDGGVDIPLILNGTVVGRVQWDAQAAASAIVEANTTPQDQLRELLDANDGRPEASALAALIVASGIGAELNLYATLVSHSVTMAAPAARSFFMQCIGCQRYFVPMWDRKKATARKGGRRSAYCSEACQKRHPRRTRTPHQKAAADRDRRDRQAAARLGTTPALLKAARANAALLKGLAHQLEPARQRALTRHLRSKKFAKRAHKTTPQ
jgi:hypothetical protein